MKRPDRGLLAQVASNRKRLETGEETISSLSKKFNRTKACIRNHVRHLNIELPRNKKMEERDQPFHTPLFLFNRRLSHGLNGL